MVDQGIYVGVVLNVRVVLRGRRSKGGGGGGGGCSLGGGIRRSRRANAIGVFEVYALLRKTGGGNSPFELELSRDLSFSRRIPYRKSCIDFFKCFLFGDLWPIGFFLGWSIGWCSRVYPLFGTCEILHRRSVHSSMGHAFSYFFPYFPLVCFILLQRRSRSMVQGAWLPHAV